MDKVQNILKKVKQIELRTRRLMTDQMVGAYHSVFKGQGMDFEEVRKYAPGDDVRSIDWNVSAKMDEPYLKTFREERELTLMLVVDLSASGCFGSQDESKRERIAELASLLAFSATKNNDKVGLLLFTDHVEHVVVPQKGRQHILRVIRDILFFKPQGTRTDVLAALERLRSLLKRRAIVFVLSDFLQNTQGQLPQWQEPKKEPILKALRIIKKRHDLTCFHVYDTRETTLPNVGPVLLEDAETGERLNLNTSSQAVRKHYAQQAQARQEALALAFSRQGIDCLSLSTEGPYVHQIQSFFNSRHRRR